MKIGDEVQTFQMRIPPKRNKIPRIYHWTRQGQDRPSQDTSHLGLDNPQEDLGNPMCPRILQLLPTIHRRFQQNSQTAIRKNKKEMYWQLGMGRQRTASIRRIKDKTHQSTSTELLRPPRTDRNRNRCLKIDFLRYTVTTMPRRKNGDQWRTDPRECRTPNATTIYTRRNHW